MNDEASNSLASLPIPSNARRICKAFIPLSDRPHPALQLVQVKCRCSRSQFESTRRVAEPLSFEGTRATYHAYWGSVRS